MSPYGLELANTERLKGRLNEANSEDAMGSPKIWMMGNEAMRAPQKQLMGRKQSQLAHIRDKPL